MPGRRVLVTGATKGIGLAISNRLAALGEHPVGLARHDSGTYPGEFHAADLADRADTARALGEVRRAGGADAIVNNVGLVRPAMLGEVDLDDLTAVFDLNVRTAVQIVQDLLPDMRERGWGRIVNITSLVTTGLPERTAYGAAKAALDFCTRAWAGELADTGITVNSVAPGPTETELFRHNNPPGSPGESRYLDLVPLRRFGQPDELAAAVSFLLSDDAAFITGHTLRVDGGAGRAA